MANSITALQTVPDEVVPCHEEAQPAHSDPDPGSCRYRAEGVCALRSVFLFRHSIIGPAGTCADWNWNAEFGKEKQAVLSGLFCSILVGGGGNADGVIGDRLVRQGDRGQGFNPGQGFGIKVDCHDTTRFDRAGRRRRRRLYSTGISRG
jgi:hypothetical protein